MAITTTEVAVDPADGWTLLATAPLGPIVVKPHSTGRAWFMAIAASLPPVSLRGLPMGRASAAGEDDMFKTDLDIAENIYVRVPASSVAQVEALDKKMIFTITKDNP